MKQMIIRKGLVDIASGTCLKEDISKEVERCLLRRSPNHLILEACKKPDGKYYILLCIDKKSWERKNDA